LNRGLETRVADQVEELGRVGRLKRFLAPQLAELIVSQGDENILESHRREIVVVFCDLRGYTAFTETAEPEEVLDFLREYHGALGPLVSQFEGTLDQFSGDGIMVFFNDPVPIPDPAARAVNMAVAMREAAGELIASWRRRRGRVLGFGVGIAQGLRDPWPDRLRGTLRLYRDRHRMQSRSAVVRGGQGWTDPSCSARCRRGQRDNAARRSWRAYPEGVNTAGSGLQRAARGQPARPPCHRRRPTECLTDGRYAPPPGARSMTGMGHEPSLELDSSNDGDGSAASVRRRFGEGLCLALNDCVGLSVTTSVVGG